MVRNGGKVRIRTSPETSKFQQLVVNAKKTRLESEHASYDRYHLITRLLQTCRSMRSI